MSLRVAVVAADIVWARTIGEHLTGADYKVGVHPSLGKFFDAISSRKPEVLIMDMHLPGMEGREIFRALRANPQTAKMILIGLSDRPRGKDEVTAAFKAGADEYFFKPLAADLLLGRLRSLLRRAPVAPDKVHFRHHGIIVYPESRLCLVDEKEVRLTRLEFDLLMEFLRNPLRVLTRGALMDALWHNHSASGARAVDRHMHALRGKLGPCGSLLETLVGVGYRLKDGTRRAS